MSIRSRMAHSPKGEAGHSVVLDQLEINDQAYLAFSRTSTRRQCFVADSGRVSIS
ncbi:hypothetical protein BDB13_2525 [Rhodococcus sp. OK302]|nr:hypothetical protein BDB13_2525 [Rhodococcus sp. OK302]